MLPLIFFLAFTKADEYDGFNYNYKNNETFDFVDNSEIYNNETFINITEQINKLKEVSKYQNYFDPNYIYDLNINEILPDNITRREQPIEIETSADSLKDSYIIELCNNATDNDNQNILTYTKLNDNNKTLVNWYMFIIEDNKMSTNRTHERWFLLTNETTDEAIQDIAYFESVCYISKDATIEPSFYSWGTDRIDQVSLPLDNKFYGSWINNNKYDGNGVAVYVFDSGIRTTHDEFKNKPSGYVINIYDHWNCRYSNGFCYDKGSVLIGNNDESKRGTHGTLVAAVLGGKNGVAPGCMIHGVKVFSKGGHTTGTITTAMSRLRNVFKQHFVNNQPVLVSMSGGTNHKHDVLNRFFSGLRDFGVLQRGVLPLEHAREPLGVRQASHHGVTQRRQHRRRV